MDRVIAGTMDTSLPDRVRQFVCDFWRESPHRLQADTRLEEDLGMTGADAAEFLNAFAETFEVDLTGIVFHKHFGPECAGPILFCPRELREEMKDLGKYPVTVGHLVEVAAAGRWSCPPPHGQKKWPDLPRRDLWDREFDG
jgi:Protein of unknown function (DUF1493)